MISIANRRNATPAPTQSLRPSKPTSALAAILLAGLLGGCATGQSGPSNWLTVFVDNFHGSAVVVGIGQDEVCQVNARLTRHNCRFPWAGTADVELQIHIPSENDTHVVTHPQATPGDRLCLTVRRDRAEVRSC